MTDGFNLGNGVNTTYPKIDEDGTVHIDPFISVNSAEDSITFLGQKYRPLVESEV